MSAIVTYRSKFEANPAPLPALFRPASTDLGDPARFHAPFNAMGLRWAIMADDANRSWQVPLFDAAGEPLWHWGQIRKRNQRGYADGIGPYLAAEKQQMADLGLTYQPDLWYSMGSTEQIESGCEDNQYGYGSQCPRIRVNDHKWQVYRHNMGVWAVSDWTNPGTPDPAPLSQVHNDTVTLVLRGAKVWARCNPWLRIAMPYGMPGEVASDSAAWNALQTLKGALEIVIGYLTDNVMMIAKGAYDIIETWYEYATADARERAADAALNDSLKGSAGSQGLLRGAPEGPVTQALRRAPRVITWTPRKKGHR